MVKSTVELPLHVVLVAPPAGVDFGVQEGKGNDYATVQIQRSTGADLHFNAMVTVKDNREDGEPNFLGPQAQGSALGRFLYIDVGTLAGQRNTPWERRIKIPLAGITWEMIRRSATGKVTLEARIPGTGRDGGPSCATVRPEGGWRRRNTPRE